MSYMYGYLGIWREFRPQCRIPIFHNGIVLEYSGPFVSIEENAARYEPAQLGGKWRGAILAGRGTGNFGSDQKLLRIRGKCKHQATIGLSGRP